MPLDAQVFAPYVASELRDQRTNVPIVFVQNGRQLRALFDRKPKSHGLNSNDSPPIAGKAGPSKRRAG